MMRKFYCLISPCHLNHLSYVIGVLLGDGCVYESHKTQIHWKTGNIAPTYTIELKVKDKSFAQEFAKRLDLVLHRPENRRFHIFQSPSGYWRTVVRNRSFGLWWKSLTNSELEDYILAFPSDFLRGVYDSEGNLTKNEVRIFSTNPDIIHFITKASKQIGFHCRSALFRPKGTEMQSPIYNGLSKKDLFVTSISPRSKFLSTVGSSIKHKNG